jgi:hypothetical protein
MADVTVGKNVIKPASSFKKFQLENGVARRRWIDKLAANSQGIWKRIHKRRAGFVSLREKAKPGELELRRVL